HHRDLHSFPPRRSSDLDVIRGSIPHARILLALRDPRDTLLNWLAFGAPIPLNMGAPISAARWLADSLAHVAVLQEQQLHPHTILDRKSTRLNSSHVKIS